MFPYPHSDGRVSKPAANFRMPSHDRYTEAQKQFFASHLRLGKDSVIKAYRQKFQDSSFSNSQYRYLRGEVGRDIKYGAPLLQQLAGEQFVFSPQSTSSITVPSPAISSLQDYKVTGGNDAFMLPSYDFSALNSPPQAAPTPVVQSSSPLTEMLNLGTLQQEFQPPPVQVMSPPQQQLPQQQQQRTPIPDPRALLGCGAVGCNIPPEAAHTHSITGEVVFSDQGVVAAMIENIRAETLSQAMLMFQTPAMEPMLPQQQEAENSVPDGTPGKTADSPSTVQNQQLFNMDIPANLYDNNSFPNFDFLENFDFSEAAIQSPQPTTTKTAATAPVQPPVAVSRPLTTAAANDGQQQDLVNLLGGAGVGSNAGSYFGDASELRFSDYPSPATQPVDNSTNGGNIGGGGGGTGGYPMASVEDMMGMNWPMDTALNDTWMNEHWTPQ